MHCECISNVWKATGDYKYLENKYLVEKRRKMMSKLVIREVCDGVG